MEEIIPKVRLLDKVRLCRNVSLIEIRTIKSKYLDQIEKWEILAAIEFDAVEFIGMASNYAIFRYEYGRMYKIHAVYLNTHLVGLLTNGKERSEVDWEYVTAEVKSVFDSIPQIFID